MNLVLLIAVGYLLGSIPWGYWLPRWSKGVDVRQHGSGNVGAANVARVAGTRWAIAVALLDISKGTAAALVGLAVAGSLGAVVAGAAAMVGHYRPLFLGFAQGGKSVATGLGAALAVAPLAALCVALLWGTLFVATRYSSIASLSSCIAMPLLAFLFGAPPPVLVFLTIACTAVIVFHRKNVVRLIRGTENRFGFSRRPWDWRTPRAPEAPPPPG
ncbi:MAG TPA: glycerol-3-phosphate 1-O-acyltransferase PlsY [Gaiellales bacterium]|nr:glycerol-3-phosphate 1-O-acyltransferase PlsY [Gaiellales bacterium]